MNKKICIVQLADSNYYQDRKNCVDSVRKYCVEHNIEWDGLVGTLNKETHIAYQKPLALMRKIEDYDYVGWIDMDIAIANKGFDLHAYLDSKKSDVVICRDPSFFNNDTANSGVVFFRNTDISKQILQEWWDSRVPGTDKHWRHQYKGASGDADQHFLNTILKKYNIVAQDPHDLNIHPKNFKVGDFAIHFMGHKPIDFDRFVEHANKHISKQELLEKYWMVYGFQSWNLIDRFYEEGRQNLMSTNKYNPEDILAAAEKLVDIEVPH